MRSFVAFLVILGCTLALATSVDEDLWAEKKHRAQEKLAHMKQQQNLDPEVVMKETIGELTLDARESLSKVTPEMREQHKEKIRRQRQRRAAEEAHRRMSAEMGLPNPRDHVQKMVHMPKEE